MSSYFKFKLTDGIHEHDFLSIKESLNSYMIFSFMKDDNKNESKSSLPTSPLEKNIIYIQNKFLINNDNISTICLRYHKYILGSVSIFFIIKNIYSISKLKTYQ